jgi:hypothetical protein
MAAFTTAQLPTGIYAITTVEELAVWSNAVLAFSNPTDSYVEAANTNRIFRFINPEFRTPDAELMRICRSAIVVDETKAQQLPSWKKAKPFSNIIIPAAFSITG